jgi:hypothetical protein
LEEPIFETAYFYCKESDPLRNTSTGIFRGLLSQLLCHCQDLIPYCHEKRIGSGEPTLSSPSLMEQLLKLFLEKIPQIFIIIDGLDECELVERKAVLTFLTSMVDHCDASIPGKLRVLIVSQDYKDIEKFMKAVPTVALTSDHSKADIEEYVLAKAHDLQSKYGLALVQGENICKTACVRADGKYRISAHSLALSNSNS